MAEKEIYLYIYKLLYKFIPYIKILQMEIWECLEPAEVEQFSLWRMGVRYLLLDLCFKVSLFPWFIRVAIDLYPKFVLRPWVAPYPWLILVPPTSLQELFSQKWLLSRPERVKFLLPLTSRDAFLTFPLTNSFEIWSEVCPFHLKQISSGTVARFPISRYPLSSLNPRP